MEWISLGISILGIVISVVGAIITTSATLSKYREKVDRIERDVEKTDKKIDAIHKDIKTVCERTAVLEAKLALTMNSVDRIAGRSDSHSPIQPTEKGMRLITDSGFMDVYEKHKDDFVDKLHKLKPRSQYDVQTKSQMMLQDYYQDPLFQDVEDWAFQNGEDILQILRLGGLILRDYYFEKHPEIVNPKEKY